MLTVIANRLLAAIAPKAEAQAYSYCQYTSPEFCRNHVRYVTQVCYYCGSNDPRSCRVTSRGYVDYGPC